MVFTCRPSVSSIAFQFRIVFKYTCTYIYTVYCLRDVNTRAPQCIVVQPFSNPSELWSCLTVIKIPWYTCIKLYLKCWQNDSHLTIKYMLHCYTAKVKRTKTMHIIHSTRQGYSNNRMKPQCNLVLCVLGKATAIAKEHSINKVSVVMVVGKFKIMRSGPKAVTVRVYLFG